MALAKNEERVARLRAELEAIDKWDENYDRKKPHDRSDVVAYEAVRLRRQEIMREIESLRIGKAV